MATLQQRVAERYPDLVPLLKQPEVGRLLTQAVQQNWSPGVFQSKFRATKWFRSQSEDARRWWVTSAMDPGTARQARSLMMGSILNLQAQMGLHLHTSELRHIRETAMRMGLSADDPWIRDQLVRFSSRGGRVVRGGAWDNTARALREMSLAEFITRPPAKVVGQWATLIMSGKRTIEDFKSYSQAQALKRYPHMAAEIQAGLTPGEIIAPLRARVAEEMETTEARIHLDNPVWRQLLGIRDPKSNKMRLMTESEVTTMARRQAGWAKTSKAKQASAAMAQSLLQTFGQRA